MADNFSNMSKETNKATNKNKDSQKKANDNFSHMQNPVNPKADKWTKHKAKEDSKGIKEANERLQKAEAKKKKATAKAVNTITPTKNDKSDTLPGTGNFDTVNISGDPKWTIARTITPTVTRQWVKFDAVFWSQYGKINASYTIGRDDSSVNQSEVSTGIQNELLGFSSTVDASQDTPTFQIMLSGMRDWEDVLLPNDYVMINVTVNDEANKSVDSDGNSLNGVPTTIITGLIADIHKTGDTSSGIGYIVTAQGVEKILQNINLGLPTDLAANQGYLIYDIGGASDPANNKPDASGQVDGSGSWDGKIPKNLKGNLKKLAPLAEKYGAKYDVKPSMIIDQALKESSIGQNVPNAYNWWGLTGSIGHGTTTVSGDSHRYTKFNSLDEAVKYYTSCMGDADPGKSHWAVKRIKGLSAKKAMKVLGGDTSYHQDGASDYTKSLENGYRSLNLKRFDSHVS